MTRVAVILSGCGYLDGAEIRESVIALTALDKAGADVTIFAPDIEQTEVVNHLTGQVVNGEKRNVLIESARIARGKISPLSKLDCTNFDALILPGGFGVAKNLSDLASNGENLTVLPEFKNAVLAFIDRKKPIGAICISPAVLVAAVSDKTTPRVTIGDDADGLIAKLGGEHHACGAKDVVIDSSNNIISCPAYMLDESLADISEGIENLISNVIDKSRFYKIG